jgi:hypothetical protein
MADLEELIERVESGTGADRGIDAQVWLSVVEKPRLGDKIDKDMIGRWPEYTSSLDAVLALIEAKLPGWHGNVEVGRPLQDSTKVSAIMIGPTEDPDDCRQADASSPARALLAATLKALKETQHADR